MTEQKNEKAKSWKRFLPTKEIICSIIVAILTIRIGSYYLPRYISKIEHRSAFTERFSTLGQTRVYMAERYYRDVSENEDKLTVSKAWDDYMESVKAWNSDNILNPLFIQYYFDQKRRDEFSNSLVPAMASLHDHLLEIRDVGTTTHVIPEEIESVKNYLFNFSEGMLGVKYSY